MQPNRSPWLGLGEASRLLGITPSTLRRWADEGHVPAFTTPGGHRRFPRAAIEGLVPAPRTRRPPLAGLGASPDRIAHAYRRARPAAPPWVATLSEGQRGDFRVRGRRLLGLLLAHLDADRPARASLLEQAEAEAAEYGSLAASLGLTLTDTVEGFLRFRGPFVGELAGVARKRGLDTREATALLEDAEAAMDRLLVSVMKGHTA